jgi:hypothetical protein
MHEEDYTDFSKKEILEKQNVEALQDTSKQQDIKLLSKGEKTNPWQTDP